MGTFSWWLPFSMLRRMNEGQRQLYAVCGGVRKSQRFEIITLGEWVHQRHLTGLPGCTEGSLEHSNHEFMWYQYALLCDFPRGCLRASVVILGIGCIYCWDFARWVWQSDKGSQLGHRHGLCACWGGQKRSKRAAGMEIIREISRSAALTRGKLLSGNSGTNQLKGQEVVGEEDWLILEWNSFQWCQRPSCDCGNGWLREKEVKKLIVHLKPALNLPRVRRGYETYPDAKNLKNEGAGVSQWQRLS